MIRLMQWWLLDTRKVEVEMFNRNVRVAEGLLNKIWKADIERINDHLPKEFKALSQLLESPTPMVKTKSGSQIIFDKEELERLSEIIPENLHDKLKLPIVLLRRIDLGRGVFQVLGDKVEAYVVLKVLGSEGVQSVEEVALPVYLYRPQVFKLRRKLRTSIVIGFAFSSRL
ncbi:MAG: hypothetical protein DRJ18_01985 [Candidatus Methanomethylicota archaeon]|nr:MAG: hypothetical protein DRJ18_01985 [Candidatus Verstraetearchaeota archaeon]